MKYSLFLLVLIFFSCNNEPKQEEIAVDTTVVQRTPPPFQIVAERPTGARALVAEPIPLETVTYFQKRTDGKYDTVVRTRFDKTITTTATATYPEWTEVIKTYKEPTTTPPVTPPTGSSKYLALTVRTTGMVISGQKGTVIENIRFKNITGNPIRINNGSDGITIRNCFFDGATEEAIVIENAKNVTITNNLFARVTCGVYALSAQTIKVNDNEFLNVRMRSIGGRGQFVQFNGVTGVGNQVNDNRGENFLGESNPEDLVSMYRSSGTLASPIEVKRNTFRGGGPSLSGGGIMLGDNGGSYQIAEGNKLLDPGQYGMAISGGSYISIINNMIYARQQAFTNNPLYLWAQAGAACGSNTVKGNTVYWIDKNGAFNGGWNAGNCSGSAFEYPAKNLTLAILGIPTHFLKYVNTTEELTIRK